MRNGLRDRARRWLFSPNHFHYSNVVRHHHHEHLAWLKCCDTECVSTSLWWYSQLRIYVHSCSASEDFHKKETAYSYPATSKMRETEIRVTTGSVRWLPGKCYVVHRQRLRGGTVASLRSMDGMRWSSIWISLSDEDGFVTLAEGSSYVRQSFS
jgi:hypothetical protein